jgi:hypothetical protein
MNLKERKVNNVAQQQTASSAAVVAGNSDEEDWDAFRHFVKIIQIVGDLMIKYENLEENLNKQIQNTFCQHHKLLSTSPSTPPKLAHTSNNANSLTMRSPEIKNVNFQFDIHQPSNSLLSINNFKVFLLEDNERIKLNTLISLIEAG